MLDAVPFHRGAVWMAQLKKLSPKISTVRLRSDADRLYSELSKGIRHELVIPMRAQYDPITVSELLSRSWELVVVRMILMEAMPGYDRVTGRCHFYSRLASAVWLSFVTFNRMGADGCMVGEFDSTSPTT